MARSLETDVVVVGAGLAGLAAARKLEVAGTDVAVLEARDRVGGRTRNHDLGSGRVVELGGAWVGPTQHRILALAGELGVETFPTWTKGRNLIEHGGRLRRYRGLVPPVNPAGLAELGVAQLRLARMAKSVSLERPWDSPHAARLDGQTARSWLERNLRTRTARALMEVAIEAVWAAEPEEISVLHMLWYTRAAGGFQQLFGIEGGAQQDRFVGGSQLVAIRAAEQLGERVILSAPVRRIEYSRDTVTARADSIEVRARRAIVAVPPALAGRIAYDPPLPAARDQLTQRTPLGTVAKCMAIYDEPFWRADGYSGQVSSTRGPVKLVIDSSPPEGTPGVLLGFLEGNRARELGRWPAERRRAAVIECFARYFGPGARRPSDYVEHLWADEEWSRGCYGCLMPPGTWTAHGHALRDPVGPLHWAGTETATVWSGYMDGAVRSGEAAAVAVTG